jgi:hypothetical protein
VLPPQVPWRDTLAVRAGAEQGFELSRGATAFARGGAFYETSPLPSELPGSEAFDVATRSTITVPTRYFDADRVVLTAGAGLSLARPLPPIELDLFGQVHLLVPRTVRSDGAEGEASGTVTVFGMTAGVRFR